MLPRRNTLESLKEQIFTDSMVMQVSDSRPALSLGPWDLGRPLVCSGPQFPPLQYGRKRCDLEFHDSPCMPGNLYSRALESLLQKSGPRSPQSCSPGGGGGAGGSAEPRGPRAKASVRTGFARTPTPLASPHAPSALNLVAPGVQEEWGKA